METMADNNFIFIIKLSLGKIRNGLFRADIMFVRQVTIDSMNSMSG